MARFKRLYVWENTDRSKSSAELKHKYVELARRGVGGVFLGGGIHEAEFDAIREVGLELHSWMWTTNRGESWIRENHPEWFMVSRSGKSCLDQPPYVPYYRWISPVIPGVQAYLQERVAELAAHPAVDGVHLDYVRYPDVILPRALWETYGLDQTHELADYDFCYGEATREAFRQKCGRDPLEITDPSTDQEWLHFRYDTITDLVKELRGVTDRYSKKLTAAVFPTPRLARKICRQDWDKWPLDGACPMTYHSFYNEGLPWIGDSVRENLHAVRFPIVAGLYMPAFEDPDQFGLGLGEAFGNGAVGVSLFAQVPDAFWDKLSPFL